jgi:hypothetical protein
MRRTRACLARRPRPAAGGSASPTLATRPIEDRARDQGARHVSLPIDLGRSLARRAHRRAESAYASRQRAGAAALPGKAITPPVAIGPSLSRRSSRSRSRAVGDECDRARRVASLLFDQRRSEGRRERSCDWSALLAGETPHCQSSIAGERGRTSRGDRPAHGLISCARR